MIFQVEWFENKNPKRKTSAPKVDVPNIIVTRDATEAGEILVGYLASKEIVSSDSFYKISAHPTVSINKVHINQKTEAGTIKYTVTLSAMNGREKPFVLTVRQNKNYLNPDGHYTDYPFSRLADAKEAFDTAIVGISSIVMDEPWKSVRVVE